MKQTIKLNDNVRVTDPCYKPDEWCSSTVRDILPGEWVCKPTFKDCGDWGKRVSRLTIRHKDYPKGRISEYVGSTAVDSGQAGFFDPEYYKEHQGVGDYDDYPKSWYRRVCDKTIEDDFGTMDERCAFASSGYGDGYYACYAARNSSGYIVALQLRFI